MPYIVTEPCIDRKDQSCIAVCPVDCIYEFQRMLLINPDECIDCGACLDECPVDAIYTEDSVPEKWEPFLEINYAIVDDRASVDDRIDAYVDAHAGR
jgi:ferredoxin